MKSVVFRADGGVTIGSGHVMRCLSLAALFSACGWDVAFAVGEGTVDAVGALGRSGYRCIELDNSGGENPAELIGLWPDGIDLLFLDHYGIDAKFERECRSWARRIVAIDDLADRPHDSDVLVDAARTDNSYRGLTSPACNILLGPEFAILRPEFREARPAALARRGASSVRRIVISFGQIDAPNATARALAAIRAVEFSGPVDVVLGRSSPHVPEIRSLASDHIRVWVDVDNVHELFASADLAVGAGGVTSWERCCMGLPTVVAMIAENQRDTISRLVGAGAALDAGIVDEGLDQRIATALADLLSDPVRRREMSTASAMLIDGQGAMRVLCAAVGPMKTGAGRSISLRPADAKDEKWLLELQRRGDTRAYSRTTDLPSESEHADWFSRVLADPRRCLLIVELDGDPGGFVRLDRMQNGRPRECFEVSIAIAPEYRNSGVAKAALQTVRETFPGWEFEAFIFPENVNSIALFRSVGFDAIGENRYRQSSGGLASSRKAL